MRSQSPTSALFELNRSRLVSLLPKNTIAVIHSNEIYSSNADATLPFKQNSDLFYLTGIAQEETILLLYPGAKNERNREILFIREENLGVRLENDFLIGEHENIDLMASIPIEPDDIERLMNS
jgi:Xaa-Pro aminopeptidase